MSSPTISITTNETNLSVGETASVKFVLSEPSTDFALEDITVSGGTLINFTGSGTNYAATFVPAVNSKTSGLVSLKDNKFSNSAGLFNIDSSDANNTVSIIMTSNAANGISVVTVESGKSVVTGGGVMTSYTEARLGLI
jgi:hypothetical protein